MKIIQSAARARVAQLMLLALLPLAASAADQTRRQHGAAQGGEGVPAPIPGPASVHGYSAKETSPGKLGISGKSLVSGEEYSGEIARSVFGPMALGHEGREGESLPPPEASSDAGRVPEASRITPTALQPRYDARQAPYSAVYRLLVRIGTNLFTCTGTPVGEYHVVTAGACLHIPPNSVGIRPGWVDQVWVMPAQTDMLWPSSDAEQPFGEAIATNMRAWTCWVNGSDPDCDFGLITLDRRLPTRTARFGFGLDLAGRPSSLRFSAYHAVDTPLAAQNPHIQFTGYDPNNVQSWLAAQIMVDARTYPGQNGAPFWNPNESGTPVLRGVLSTTLSSTRARVTRITQDEVNFFNESRAEDNTSHPPTNMPDILEQTRTVEEQPKRVHTPSVARGGVLRFRYNAFNSGFANSGAVTSHFYLSRSAENIAPGTDPYLGVDTRPNLLLNTYALYEHQLTVPASVPPGQYYLYWIMFSGNPEYPGANYCSSDPNASDCNSFGKVGPVLVTAGGGGVSNPIFQDGFE